MISFLVIVASGLVAIYTLNYAGWAWRQRLRLGAAGLVLLAVASVAVPVYVMWYLA